MRGSVHRLLSVVLGVAVGVAATACDTDFDPGFKARDGGNGDKIVPQPDGGENDGGEDGGDDGGDGPVACEDAVCNPVVGAGCEGPLACVLVAEQVACGTAGVGLEGAACDAVSDCGPGLACFKQGSGPALCERVCCGAADPCAALDQKCVEAGVLVDNTATPWGHCVDRVTCNPTESGGPCGEGLSCYVASGSGSTDCLPTGAGVAGESCAVPEDCAPGHVCAGIGAKSCRALCDLDDGDAVCGEDERCVAYAYTPDGAGVCTPR